MTPKECAKAWITVKEIYEKTRETNPKTTVSKIVESLGLDVTKEVFATISEIKRKDGRIYGMNREFMKSIPTNPECTEWSSDNLVIRAGLDDIHTTHINQMITELRAIS